MSSSLHRRAGLVLLAVALTSAACAGGGEPGVAVKDVAADISFGLKAATDKAGENVVNPTAVDTDLEPTETVALEQTVAKRLGPSLKAAESCPRARANAFPKKHADLQSDGTPQEGLYRWKRGGQEQLFSVGPQPLPISGFEERIIRNVEVTNDFTNPTSGERNLEYTYEMVLPNRDIGGTTTLLFQVKTNALAQQEVNTRTGQQARAGEPERGLVIKRRTDRDRRGNVEEYDFGTTGLLLLPLPVIPGEEFTSNAFGTRETANATYSGRVVGKQRIDACGEVVEGWYVEGLLRDPTGRQASYNMIIATQYGAMLIFEHFGYANSAGSFAPEFTLGQLNPSPAPPEDVE